MVSDQVVADANQGYVALPPAPAPGADSDTASMYMAIFDDLFFNF